MPTVPQNRICYHNFGTGVSKSCKGLDVEVDEVQIKREMILQSENNRHSTEDYKKLRG